MMQTRWETETIDYDGSQLRAHWLLDRFGLVGDALVAFRGAADCPLWEANCYAAAAMVEMWVCFLLLYLSCDLYTCVTSGHFSLGFSFKPA